MKFSSLSDKPIEVCFVSNPFDIMNLHEHPFRIYQWDSPTVNIKGMHSIFLIGSYVDKPSCMLAFSTVVDENPKGKFFVAHAVTKEMRIPDSWLNKEEI